MMATGKSCGTCNLCCKILEIPELDKAANAWCTHCDIGIGCKAYEARPATCRDFMCRYLVDPALDEQWHPATCRFILCIDHASNLVIQVDPQRPDAWKREPYHSSFRRHAKTVYQRGTMIFVKIGSRTFLILPDRDADLGDFGPNDRVTLIPAYSSAGPRWEVKVERGVRR